MVPNGSLKSNVSSITLGARIESRGHCSVYCDSDSVCDVERTGDKRLLSGSEQSHPPCALTLTPPPLASHYCQNTIIATGVFIIQGLSGLWYELQR